MRAGFVGTVLGMMPVSGGIGRVTLSDAALGVGAISPQAPRGPIWHPYRIAASAPTGRVCEPTHGLLPLACGRQHMYLSALRTIARGEHSIKILLASAPIWEKRKAHKASG